MDDNEPFLARWSRRKLDAREAQPEARLQPESPAVAAVAPASAVDPAAACLPQESTPEYRKYFDPRVEESLRRSALKQLFSDPHFNVMDGLDTYIDDYSRPDPIPQEMLRRLNQAKELFLFDEEKDAAEGLDEAATVRSDLAASPAAAADANSSPERESADVCGKDAELGPIGAMAAPVENGKNN